MTLNNFLNRLPELVVDCLVFERSDESAGPSSYHIAGGTWKLRKIGHKYYDVSKNISGSYHKYAQWTTGDRAGDIHILKLNLTHKGVIVVLGTDIEGY